MSETQNYILAEQDYVYGMKYKDIAEKYGVTINTVKSWKVRYKWNKKGVHTKSEKVCTQNEKSVHTKRKKGAQLGNQNASGHGAPIGNQNAVGHGAPKKNKNAEKYGFFSKYLPEETVSIIEEMPDNPLDVLWDQIQIAYAAIIRAQNIMYVKDRDDKTIEKVGESSGDVFSEKWEV